MIRWFAAVLILLTSVFGSVADAQDSLHAGLGIDTAYSNLNFYSNGTARRFLQLFESAKREKLVVFHFGGSHIQAERPTTVVRDSLTGRFGDGGRGMIFPYEIANTYASSNYTTNFAGTWDYGKSFQTDLALPLGICGMGVQTRDTAARLEFNFREPIKRNDYELRLMMDVDSMSPQFSVTVDASVYDVTSEVLQENYGKGFLSFGYSGSIRNISIRLTKQDTSILFRFYGISIETRRPSGVVYHSLGVGAAPFRSILNIEKLEEHAAILKPDLVLLDFGTNDILYNNAIDEKLSAQIEAGIQRFRAVNPEVLIVLTSTQDLYYKRRFITAGVAFRNLIDSLARKNDCLFWNWYDLAGGYGTIRRWHDRGYALKDGVHLTPRGYKLKGQLLFESMMHTLKFIEANPSSSGLHSGLKDYSTLMSAAESSSGASGSRRYHTVRSGESLSVIGRKYGISVKRIKAINRLKSDLIRPGQRLLVRD